ncbi:hypothetical protein [Pseudomonas sp. Y3 TE3536]
MRIFLKLRTAVYLKARSDASAAIVGISGRIARIACTHQPGLTDEAAPCAPSITYSVPNCWD